MKGTLFVVLAIATTIPAEARENQTPPVNQTNVVHCDVLSGLEHVPSGSGFDFVLTTELSADGTRVLWKMRLDRVTDDLKRLFAKHGIKVGVPLFENRLDVGLSKWEIQETLDPDGNVELWAPFVESGKKFAAYQPTWSDRIRTVTGLGKEVADKTRLAAETAQGIGLLRFAEEDGFRSDEDHVKRVKCVLTTYSSTELAGPSGPGINDRHVNKAVTGEPTDRSPKGSRTDRSRGAF